MFQVEKHIDLQKKEEILLVGIFNEPNKLNQWFDGVEDNFQEQLQDLVQSGDISGNLKSHTVVHTLGFVGAKRILFIGLGKKKELTSEKLREVFGKAFKVVQGHKVSSVSVLLDSFINETMTNEEAAHILGESLEMATYQFAGYKQKPNIPEVYIEQVTVYSETDQNSVQNALFIGSVYGKATNSARTLVNTPGNLLTSTDLAEYALKLAEKYGFEPEILEKEDMEKLGMGGLLAVNQGSTEPPKMIVLKYQGKKEWKDVIGLVGKGITFDTGGYSIKTKTGIVGMKTDMGGAAAVLGAMEIIGELKPEQNVVAVIPSTDNMISGNAFKPDDVITTLSGKTVEVLNTDAEGRLVLADGITYAKQHGADYLVDVATLTGGVITALGSDKTGAFTNNEEFYQQVLQSSKATDEMLWLLPLTEKDRAKVRDSKIADLNNSPTREGHAIMGAGFVGEFAEDTPWVHLDIAGTSTTRSAHDLGPAGATGVMVRTLAKFVSDFK